MTILGTLGSLDAFDDIGACRSDHEEGEDCRIIWPPEEIINAMRYDPSDWTYRHGLEHFEGFMQAQTMMPGAEQVAEEIDEFHQAYLGWVSFLAYDAEH